MIEVKKYDSLPPVAAEIRKSVFMDEQGFSYDIDDKDSVATHFVAFADGTPVGTCRLYKDGKYNDWILGRVAVLSEHRGKGIGGKLLKEVEEFVCALHGRVLVHAQLRAFDFYAFYSYSAISEIDYEEGTPHMWLEKDLSEYN